MRLLGAVLGAVLRASFGICGLCALSVPVLAQMPDPSVMNGRSLPAPDAPAGTTTVRLMRERIGNNVPGQDVSLVDASGATIGPRKTHDGGRATFEGLRPGTTYRAVAIVAGEKLESLPFTQPDAGGLRVVLFAGLGAGEPVGRGTRRSGGARGPRPSSPGRQHHARHAVPDRRRAGGRVRRGLRARRCRQRHGRAGIAAGAARVYAARRRARSAVLEGSTDVAALDGGRIVVKGPLPSGPTAVQFGYRLPSDTGSASIRQTLPLAGPMSTVIVRQSGATAVTVAGERARRDTTLEGRQDIVATTGAVQPSTPLAVTVSGLPSRSRWPVRLALGLAAGIVLLGIVFGRARADDDAAAPLPARS